MNKPRFKKTWYLAAASDVPFQTMCQKLQEHFRLSEFIKDAEDNWVYSYAENETAGINISRAEDYKTIENWMLNSPSGVNYQLIVYSNESVENVMSFLKNSFGIDAILYASKNAEA